VSSHPEPVRPDAIRAHNLAVMLAHIHRDGALTRAELTQRLGVSRSTVAALVADLGHLGVVEEVVPTGGDRVGRPSHVVAPHRSGPVAIAVDVDVADVTVAVVGLGGAVLGRETIRCAPAETSPQEIVEVIVSAFPRLHEGSAPDAALAGIGVSVPGTVRRNSGYVSVAPNLGWRDVPLGEQLAARVPSHLTLAIGNDADLAVLAEHHRGVARGVDDVVFLLGRKGIGAGIVANGRPLRGRDGYAGEIGHNVVDPTGPHCHCGKRGCVETYVGESALLGAASSAQRVLANPGSAAVFAAARGGDAAALQVVRGVAVALGRTVASLANTLNPDCIVLGGYLAELLDVARVDIERALHQRTFESSGRDLRLLPPALGSDSMLLGAAELAFAGLLADPLTVAPSLRAAAGLPS
jgi:predicted NBD/HSP70 family sugar kinase